MPDEELTLLQREGLRVNREKDIRENLADELKEILTPDEAEHLRVGSMMPLLAVSIASLRLYMKGRR